MGANTKWYVKVRKLREEIIEVRAVTRDDAREVARKEDGVIIVDEVKHWEEVEEDKSLGY